MKRSSRNIFIPFTVSLSQPRNRFLPQKKLNMVGGKSVQNWTAAKPDFQDNQYTHNVNTDYFTAFDLDMGTPHFSEATKDDTDFIFDSAVVDNKGTKEPCLDVNERNGIIATHWGEADDYKLINNINSREDAQKLAMDNVVDDKKEYKPFLWFI